MVALRCRIGWIDHDPELEAIRAWFEARSLDLAVIERPNGTWRAVVMPRDGTRGQRSTPTGATRSTQPGAPPRGTRQADCESHCRGWLRSPRARLSNSCSPRPWSLESPAGRTRAGRRAALVGDGLDARSEAPGRDRTRSPARPSSGRAYGCTTVPPIKTSRARRSVRWNACAGRCDAVWIHPADRAISTSVASRRGQSSGVRPHALPDLEMWCVAGRPASGRTRSITGVC